MIEFENHLGKTTVYNKYIINLIAISIKECFGVVGISSIHIPKIIKKVFKSSNPYKKGISLTQHKNLINIDLHIFVSYNTNIKIITDSIYKKLKYVISDISDLTINNINFFIEKLN